MHKNFFVEKKLILKYLCTVIDRCGSYPHHQEHIKDFQKKKILPS